MCVALPWLVMLVSEISIIYFAAAAPFGVSRFLHERAKGARVRPALLKAACATLAWPFTSLRSLPRRIASRARAASACDEGRAVGGRGVEQLTRAAVNSLREVEDLLAGCDALEGEGARHALYAARECVERYSGLALACAGADAEAGPTPREMELCRIAGRAGDDLLVAGRCIHRRNVTRLFAHRERARAELLRALAEMREVTNGTYAARRPFGFTQTAPCVDAGHLPAALSRALASVVELLSLFGDEATKGGVTRLLEERGARACGAESRGGAGTGAATQEGEESCTTPAVHTAFATQRLRTPTPQGG